MHLSVTSEMYVTVLVDGKAKQLPVSKATGEHKVPGWFGETYDVVICAADEEEDYYMFSSSSGEAMIIGQTHSVLSRDPRSALWERVLATDIQDIRLGKLPQRKTSADESLFDLLNVDSEGIFLSPTKGSMIFEASRLAAYCGIAVSRRKSELRVDLDKGRAACFASKLINGAFDEDAYTALNSLVASTIIRPPVLFGDKYVADVLSTGVIFEGSTYNNDIPILSPRKLQKSGPVFHIRVDNPLTPVEMTWCQS